MLAMRTTYLLTEMLAANSHEFAAIPTLKLNWLHKGSPRGRAASGLRLLFDVSISSAMPRPLQCRFGFLRLSFRFLTLIASVIWFFEKRLRKSNQAAA